MKNFTLCKVESYRHLSFSDHFIEKNFFCVLKVLEVHPNLKSKCRASYTQDKSPGNLADYFPVGLTITSIKSLCHVNCNFPTLLPQ